MNEDWDRVAAAVSDRMIELGLSTSGVEAAGGPSPPTIKKFLDGKPVVKRGPLTKMATALQWQPDAFDRILVGDDPVPLELSESDRVWEAIEDLVERLHIIERHVGLRPEVDVHRIYVAAKPVAADTGDAEPEAGPRALRPSSVEPEPEDP